MSDVEGLVKAGVAKRVASIRAMDRDFRAMQRSKLASILRNCAETEFGRAHDFGSIASHEDYRRAVPPSTAEDYHEAWKRIASGARNVLFPEPVYSYGLSSGTTGEPKMVPLTKALVRGLKRAIGYTTASYIALREDYALLRGYALQMAAPTEVRRTNGDVPVGYITGIMSASRTYPFHNIGIPPNDVLDLLDWGEKYRLVEERFAGHDVRMIFGIPGYILGLLRRLTGSRGLDNLDGLWPNLELVATSGVALRPHRPQLERLCPHARLMETYLCTEGPVAFERTEGPPGMLPMVEDLFLEFVPEDRWDEERGPRLALEEVEPGVEYVILLTTPAGLYAYAPGDVVRFTSVDPPRLVVEGRHGNVLSLASEKLDEAQAESILARAGLAVEAFSVCPAEAGPAPGHEWVIEFSGSPPTDAAERIDRAMRAANPLLRHLREGDLLFAAPRVSPVRKGTFDAALRRRPGQGKILRIYQDRTVRDELLGTDRA